MPELITPYDFALANIDGLNAMNMISGHKYSNREMTVTFKQPTRVGFIGSHSFTSADFVDWEQPQSYTANTTIRIPYGTMTLDNKNAETDITYTDNKRWILDDNVHTLAFGHYRLKNIKEAVFGQQGSDGSEGWDPILVRVDPGKCSICVSEPKVSME